MPVEIETVELRDLSKVFDNIVDRNYSKPEWISVLPEVGLQSLPLETVLSDWLDENELILTDRMAEKGLTEYKIDGAIHCLRMATNGKIVGTDRTLMFGRKMLIGELRTLSIEKLRFLEGLSYGYRADIVKAMIG